MVHAKTPYYYKFDLWESEMKEMMFKKEILNVIYAYLFNFYGKNFKFCMGWSFFKHASLIIYSLMVSFLDMKKMLSITKHGY